MLTKFKTRASVNKKTALRVVKYVIIVIIGFVFGLIIHFINPEKIGWAITLVTAVLFLFGHMVLNVLKTLSPSNIKNVKAQVREETLDNKIARFTKLEDEIAVLLEDIQKDKEFKAKKEAEKQAILKRIGKNIIDKKMGDLHK